MTEVVTMLSATLHQRVVIGVKVSAGWRGDSNGGGVGFYEWGSVCNHVTAFGAAEGWGGGRRLEWEVAQGLGGGGDSGLHMP